ncbi:MAG TPA: hypothetical protein VEC99_04250, partial [Clostridia bacterium]|nr:hypothetical protein [Clostridia bacterium]
TLLFITTTLLLASGTAFAAPSNAKLGGNWKGTLEVGQVKLRLVFKVNQAADGACSAKLDSIDQGARDIPVEKVTLTENTVRMEIPSIQGIYEGKLDTAGTTINGQWRQGGQQLPLKLEKAQGAVALVENEKLSPADLAASKLAAQKLAGSWNGTLAIGGTNLRLRLNVAEAASGAAAGTLDSLDQGANGIPVSALTLKEGKLHFEARGIQGTYDGALDADGATLKGEWRQGGSSLPLELKRATAAK